MDFNANLLLHAAPAMLLLAISEFILMNHEHRSKETRRNLLNSYILAAGFLTVTATMKAIPLMLYTWLYQFRLFDLELNAWWLVILCIVCDDLTCYWSHRMTHSVRFFWASHLVHHSSETFNLTSGSRQSWIGVYTGSFLLWAWLPLVGFSAELILYVKSISTIYQFFLHTETIKKFPAWVEFIFNTPSHHRVHHSSDLENLDMNNGAMLIIWDRMFGTFREEGSLKHNYGLCKRIEDPTPISINFKEVSDIIRDVKKVNLFKHKFMYIFGAPGWSHDGSTKTAKQLRTELARQTTIVIEMRKPVPDPASFHRKKAVQLVGSRQ
jgi:sterol desaturase/sphingolipid hydroxylase (fatty acid hydroxylase superfamily)